MSSFPCVIYGEFGDEKVAQSTKIGGLPLGTRMMLPDGREFAHARMSATAGIAGNLYQGGNEAATTDSGLDFDLALATAAAIGDRTISITMSATTAMTKTLFEDGYVWACDSTGEGQVFKIKDSATAAAGSTAIINLYENDKVHTALLAASTQMGIHASEFDDLIKTTANTVGTCSLAGILPVAASANFYCWVQRRGVCAALTDGTLLIGSQVVPSDGLAGAVAPQKASSASTAGVAIIAKDFTTLGECMVVAGSTDYSLIDLRM